MQASNKTVQATFGGQGHKLKFTIIGWKMFFLKLKSGSEIGQVSVDADGTARRAA